MTGSNDTFQVYMYMLKRNLIDKLIPKNTKTSRRSTFVRKTLCPFPHFSRYPTPKRLVMPVYLEGGAPPPPPPELELATPPDS